MLTVLFGPAVLVTCGGEEQWEQGVMSRGAQQQECPSILSVLHRQDAAGNKHGSKSPLGSARSLTGRTGSAHLSGTMARRTAFSWTCHPNMKEPRAQSTRQRRKPRPPVGRHQTDAAAGFRGGELRTPEPEPEPETGPGPAPTHQDGQKGADERDGGRDGGEHRVLELLDQTARHGGLRKLRLLQQLQMHASTKQELTLFKLSK